MQSVELDGETVLYDERNGALHLLNRSASVVWQTIDGIFCVADIGAHLAERFHVSAERMRNDVRELLELFHEARLIEIHERSKAGRHRPR